MEVVASLSQGRTAAAQCGLFTHKSVPVIFEPPCTLQYLQRDLHRVAITCDSVISSQTITNFKHIKILFQLFTHDSDIITGQGITKLMILYSL